MSRSAGPFALALLIAALVSSACGPTLPPVEAPPQPEPALDPLLAALQSYIERTQPYRKKVAEAQEKVRGRAEPTPSAAVALRASRLERDDQDRYAWRPTPWTGMSCPASTSCCSANIDAAAWSMCRTNAIEPCRTGLSRSRS